MVRGAIVINVLLLDVGEHGNAIQNRCNEPSFIRHHLKNLWDSEKGKVVAFLLYNYMCSHI